MPTPQESHEDAVASAPATGQDTGAIPLLQFSNPRPSGVNPLPLIALAFAGGIGAAANGGPLLLAPAVLFVLILGIALVTQRARWLGLGVMLAFFLLGATRYLVTLNPPTDSVAQLAPTSITLTGVVESDVETVLPESPERPPMAHCLFATQRVEAVETTRRPLPASGLVALSLPLGEVRHGRLELCRPQDLPRYGDRMTIHGRLEPPTGPRNPGGFDAAAMLARREAEATFTATHLSDWHLVSPTAELHPILAAAYALRGEVIRQMRLGLPPEHAAFMEGLLLGARGDLSEDLNTAFERTGAAHLLATAGLHVGLLTWILLALLRRLRMPRRPALFAVMALLPVYAIMTGGRPGVTRAVIVAELVLLGPLLEREPNLPNALSLAALFLLLRDPRSLFDAGFQLSFATVITILVLLPPTEAAIRRLCEPIAYRHPQAVRLQRGLQSLAMAFFLAVIAQIGAGPLVAYHYHDLSLIAPVANALIVPFAGLLIALGTLGVALGTLHPLLAWPVDRLLNGLLTPVIALVRAFAAPAWADLPVVSPPLALLGLYYGLIWGGACYASHRAAHRRREPGLKVDAELARSRSVRPAAEARRPLWNPLALLACGALTLWLWNAYATRGSGRLEIWFLNVGQGDAAVLRTPAGKTLVVDAGSSEANGADAGRRVLVPFLRSQGLGRIDSLILTSRRGEQSGGAVTLLRQVEVGTLIDTGQPPGPRLQTAILQAALDRHVPCKAAHAGDTLECGDGVTLRFLTPSRERAPAGIGNTESRNTNPADTGLVFRVEYGRTALLFMNGADNVVEANLIRSRQPLACDVLKVARQGNADATTVGLLAAARPRFAVISVSAHNLFHDPSLDVIARLQNVGARIYRTDQSGAIACISDGVTFRLTPTLPAQP